jgi:hypothetical protein
MLILGTSPNRECRMMRQHLIQRVRRRLERPICVSDIRAFEIPTDNTKQQSCGGLYERPSPFSREYVRLFGLPPARDAARMRGVEETAAIG